MTVATPSGSVGEAGVLSGGLAARQLRYFKAQVEDWRDACRRLATWEDQYLVDNPTTQCIAEHAQLLDELERVGRWLSQAVQSPDFPDQPTRALVTLTLQDLQDARALWHGPPMSEIRRAEILKHCFNES